MKNLAEILREYEYYLLTQTVVARAAKLFILFMILRLIRSIILPPSNFPKNIPTIPFYVSFLGTYTSMDQGEIYDRYLRERLEKYGAVNIYFASRWNVLVTRPEYLGQIFKNDNIFRKSGNQEKIPYSILSQYTGENVISADGSNWKLYRRLITTGLQFYSTNPTYSNSKKLIRIISSQVENNGNSILIGDILQKFTLANICESMLGTYFDTLDSPEPELHLKLKNVKMQIFKPFYLNFPIFDRFPIPSRLRARKNVQEFREYFCEKVKECQLEEGADEKTSGYRLHEALVDSILEEQQFQDNAVIIMVAGHENPQLLLTSLLYVLAKNIPIQDKIRKEALDAKKGCHTYFHSVLYETLRMYPPLGQIVNRKTTADTVLGQNIFIPKGVYVGYNNYGTGRDRNVWGADADMFKPHRWGSTEEEIARNYSIAKSSAKLPTFHGRKRACLGEKFALFETEIVILEIIRNFRIHLDPLWNDKLTPAGPISPFQLKLCFSPI